MPLIPSPIPRSAARPIVGLSVMLGLALLGAFSVALLSAVERIDARALVAERRDIAAGLQQQMERLPIEQDSSIVWNEAVTHLRADNQAWIAENLVEWTSEFFAHDRVYVVAPNGQVVRAADQGEYAGETLNPRDEPAVTAMIGQFRTRLAEASVGLEDSTAAISGLGLSDTVRLADNEIAFISVRPVIGTTIRQAPGTEFVHVSVKLIGATLLGDLAERFGLSDLHIGRPSRNLATLPILNNGGRTIGYIAWTPNRPAFVLLRETAPATLSILFLGVASLVGLLTWLRRTSAQLEASRAQTAYLAFHDPLTGVANRALFETRIRQALGYQHLARTKVALISIDLDRFKEINDTLGHAAGDQLIQQVAKRLAFSLPEEATLTRLGGDEFALIQPGVVTDGHAEWICRELVRAFQDPFGLTAGSVQVTASFGVALEYGNEVTVEELQRRADVALYAAKAAGRNRFEIYHEDMDRSRREKRTLEIDLRNALINGGELFIVYQPIFDAHNGAMAGAEALVRWQHPTRGHLPPDSFIAVAEETGLIDQLGLWVLEEACRFAMEAELPWIAVNASPHQFQDPNFPLRVLDILRRLGFAPERLELEITEGLLLQNSPLVQTGLVHLRDAGVRIALDDFGTGYSSISYLRTYSVDKLKIDRSFIRLLGRDDATDSIVRSVIEMARALHMSVTAEGVEEEPQRRLLKTLGCTHLQGYLLSRPVTAERLSAMVIERRSAA